MAAQDCQGPGSPGITSKPTLYGFTESAGDHILGYEPLNSLFPKMEHLSLKIIFMREGFHGQIKLENVIFSAWRFTVFICNSEYRLRKMFNQISPWVSKIHLMIEW